MPKTKKNNQEIEDNLDMFEDDDIEINIQDDLSTYEFYNKYVDLQGEIEMMSYNRTLTKDEFLKYLNQLKSLEEDRLKRPDSDRIEKDGANPLKASLIKHSAYPKYYIQDLVNNIADSKNIAKDVDKAEAEYFKDVKEEDRYKVSDHGKDYSDMVVGKHDILAEADAVNKDLNGKVGTIDDSKTIKDNIELYHKLNQANKERGWFSKLLSAVKGFFGGRTEDKALAEMKENIINSCAYDRDLAVKALETPSEDHLNQILFTGNRRYMEKQEKEAEVKENANLGKNGKLMDISDKDLDITNERKQELEKLNKVDEVELSKDDFEESYEAEL